MGIQEYLGDAINHGKTVTIKYIKYTGEYSTRQISNIHYSDEFGPDYIKAFCHLRNEDRTFKISRIISIDGITDTPASSPTGKKPKTAYTGSSSSAGTAKTNSSSSAYSSIVSSGNSSDSSSSSGYRTYNYKTSTYVPKPSSSFSNSKKSEGCYIATMVYGNYDHSQVIVLRRYRDEVLLQSVLGRLFVKVYYWLSPELVKMLQGHEAINAFIRSILDKIVEKIDK